MLAFRQMLDADGRKEHIPRLTIQYHSQYGDYRLTAVSALTWPWPLNEL